MKERVAIISILVNIILAAGKITVGLITISSAVLAEGLHSFMDIISSATGYIGIKISKKPVDEKHPYGYYKFEVLAGVLITLILLASGLGIIYEAWQGFRKPQGIQTDYLAYIVMVFSALVNEIMARWKTAVGKKENSIALLSDGVHSRVDVFISVAVIGGLFLAKYWIYADPLLALLIGFYIIKESLSLGKEAVDSLLDVSAGGEIERKIKSIAGENKVEVSFIKTQKKGSVITANLGIKLPARLSVEEAVRISGDLREKLTEEIENLVYVVIQMESHEVSTGFYSPSFGRGFCWQKKGEFKKDADELSGKGPGGYCVCSQCGYKIEHKPGTPCSALNCPHCNVNLERQS
jgi:cation diffusion facilitator family transporter